MYGSVQRLAEISQVGVGDLHLSPAPLQTKEDRLQELFREILLDAKDFIDNDRNRDYNLEVAQGLRTAVPPGIHNIALQLASNMLLQMRQRQAARLMSKNDQQIEMVISAALTPDIRRALDIYPAKPQLSSPLMGGFGMVRLRTTNPVTGLRE